MIRDEAKLEFFTLLESGIIDFKEKNIIDKIYDSFENRSCENCKFLDMDLICTNLNTPCYSEYSGRYDNFGCSEWESK